jgi:diguanylate cyclase (GGDEF)-like protein
VTESEVSTERRASAVSRRWALWSLPRRLVALVVSVDAVAVALMVYAIVTDSVTNADLVRFSVLVLLSVAYIEVSRQIEFQRRLIAAGSAHVDVTSVWLFAGALILPPSLAVIAVVASFAHLWARSWSRVDGARPYRVVYSAAGVALTCFSVSTMLRHIDPAGIFWSTPIAAAGLIVLSVCVYRLVNRSIVAIAVIASTGAPVRAALVGRWSDHALELATLALGAVTAGCVAYAPWFVVMVLPAVFLLQHQNLIKELVEAATMDVKTDLLNATTWRQLAGRELARAERGDQSAAILLIDMDHFKQINDTHGHLAGDDALRAVGEALADELRGYDAVGRFGGEEFVALLPEAGIDDAPRVAERVRRRIESLQVSDGGALVRLSASVGVAIYPRHGTELDTLIRAADRALYAAKDAGRNAVRVALMSVRAA